MHMADALITPLVGGAMYLAAAKAGSVSIKQIRRQLDESRIPLMGVMGAFVFAAQMINFTIPGTGSSGHLGGGMLLAVILGPHAGFLAMASILLIQALFFADGGLLALGCNMINLGFYTCFVAYPYIYKKLIGEGYSTARITLASMAASIVGLQLGAFSVVIQTMLSGVIDMPFTLFLVLMQSIHLAIGIVEGLITAAVVNFVWKARPELLEGAQAGKKAAGSVPLKRILVVFVVAALLIGGILSWYASSNPDGLEWALYNSAGTEQESKSTIHQKAAQLQEKISPLPEYGFKEGIDTSVRTATSFSGIIGSLIVLAIAAGIGKLIKIISKKTAGNKV